MLGTARSAHQEQRDEVAENGHRQKPGQAQSPGREWSGKHKPETANPQRGLTPPEPACHSHIKIGRGGTQEGGVWMRDTVW